MVELCKLCWELGGPFHEGRLSRWGRAAGSLRFGREAAGQTDWSGSHGGGHSNQTDVCGRVSIAE